MEGKMMADWYTDAASSYSRLIYCNLIPWFQMQTSNDTSLFYALRGGRSAFGVLIDVTSKLHKDSTVTEFKCSYAAFGGTELPLQSLLRAVVSKVAVLQSF